MMQMMWPILIVIAANTLYNICAKQTPQNINSFFSLGVTYGVAMVISMILYFITADQKNPMSEFAKTNWASVALGISVVALEFGYINIYRAGWKINTASLAANIGLAIILLFVGFMLYKEAISIRQLAGVVVCAVGLILITEP